GEDELVDTVSCVRAQPHPHRTAEGETTEREPVDAEPVEEREQLPTEHLDRVRAGRDVRASVAELVVAQHPERAGKCRYLRVPELECRPDRVREHENRR